MLKSGHKEITSNLLMRPMLCLFLPDDEGRQEFLRAQHLVMR